jgi:hypothetical protein
MGDSMTTLLNTIFIKPLLLIGAGILLVVASLMRRSAKPAKPSPGGESTLSGKRRVIGVTPSQP